MDLSTEHTLTASEIAVNVNGLIINDGYIEAEDVRVESGGTFELNQAMMIADMWIGDGGVLTHTAEQDGFQLTVAGDLTIEAGGSITADGKGYGAESGPGDGRSASYVGGGAGYGGAGGRGIHNDALGGKTYGLAAQPVALGSGGGMISPRGGAGGGLIWVTVAWMLQVDGTLTVNGNNGGTGGMYPICASGGGSGGSIYLTVGALAGAGEISANGGDSGRNDAGGGGGGRIAIYYGNTTFAGNIEAKGGLGYEPGEDGTVIFETLSSNAPTAVSDLTEQSSTVDTLVESILVQEVLLNDANMSGDLEGSIDFTDFEFIRVNSGAFAEKGFFKAKMQADIEGANYTGTYQGIIFPDPKERRIYLKGSVSEEICGIAEGYLIESVDDSNVYDQYNFTWRLSRVGSEIVSATVSLAGRMNYQETIEYPATKLYALQTSIDGSTSGHYTGSLGVVLTHLRVAEESNPYYGEGFSIISYVSDSGQGQCWTYDKLFGSGKVQLTGLSSGPLLGIVSGLLDETKTPRSLFLVIERIDLGLPLMPDLEVRTWGPAMVTPGQAMNYMIEVRNDGVKSAEDVVVIDMLPAEVSYISSTSEGIYRPGTHEVIWKLGAVAAKSKALLAANVEVAWGLDFGTAFKNAAIIGTTGDEIDTYLDEEIDFDILEHLDYIYVVSVEHLTPEEFETELLSDSRFLELVLYAEENGYTYSNIALRMLLSNGTFLNMVIMFDSVNPQGVFFVIQHEQASPMIMEVDEYMVSFGDGQGFMSYSLISPTTLETSCSGSWCAANSCTIWDCINNGIFGKVPLYLLGKISSAISSAIKIKDCFKCGITGEKKYCDECAGAILEELKLVPGIGELITIGAIIEDCRNNPGQYSGQHREQKKFCRRTPSGWKWIGYAEDVHWYEWGRALFGLPQNRDYVAIYIFDEDFCFWFLYDMYACPRCNTCINGENARCVPTQKANADKDYQCVMRIAHDPSMKYGPERNVLPGERLDYTVEYENEGQGVAYGVYFTDTLDEDLDDLALEIGPVVDVNDGSIISEPGTYNPATRTITWFAGEVDPNEGGYADFSINVMADANDGTEIINYATIYFPSVPEETRTNGIVSIVFFNQPPVADAGEDQIVYTDSSGIAEVVLDGSDSNDVDGDELGYLWSWTIGAEDYDANGVNPIIELPCGEHAIGLVVNDGMEDSEPDEVVITVTCNATPIADAGEDRTVYTDSGGVAEVVLDGSESNDADGDELSYYWSWMVNGQLYDAGGVGPTVELPCGVHSIGLVVNDGIEDSETDEVVITVVCNTAPVADAGEDQTVYAWINGVAEVTLDGSGSTDPDGDELTYTWFLDGQEIATGVDPSIELQVGEHTIELIVNDGIEDSELDVVSVTAEASMEVAIKFTPRVLNASSKGKWVKGHFVLPEGFAIEDVDTCTAATIEPLGIPSDHMNVFINEDGLVEIEAAFGRGDFCRGIDYGPVEVTVTGRLTSGQYFYGTDTIRIISNKLEHLAVFASHWLEADCSAPDWCSGFDLDRDSKIDFVDFALTKSCCIEIIKQ